MIVTDSAHTYVTYTVHDNTWTWQARRFRCKLAQAAVAYPTAMILGVEGSATCHEFRDLMGFRWLISMWEKWDFDG